MTQTPQTTTATNGSSATETVDAVVVGAGFAGLYMLYRLRELGLTTKAFEAGNDIGGTWYWNRYPGARCDVESLEYSFSFSKELEQDWDWTEKYATQPEILGYANHVADRFDLRRDIQLSTRVVAAVFDEGARRWTVSTDRGDRVSAQFCVMATGCLSTPKWPEVPGRDRFEGRSFHTGLWPHEGVDLSGQRVAVIGTGSSGIQSIPIFAEQADDLTVFQRTPNFSFPAGNRPLDPGVVDAMKAAYPAHRQEARESGFGIPVELPEKSALEVPEDERRTMYEERWGRGNLVALMLAYNDLIYDKEANDTAAEFVRDKIRQTVKDPTVAELLCPTDHPMGTKRPCLDTNYYATYNRDDVHLVDVRSTPILEITPTGIRTTEKDYEFDTIIYATGFDAMTGAVTNIDVRGSGGASLKEKWAAGPRTYLGVSVAGFPNLFTITGPGSPSVLSNMMVSIEQHVDWIGDCIRYLRDRDIAAIDATPEAEDEWVEHVREVGETTLYPLANSWYMGSNVAGKVRVFMPYIGGVGVYRQKCDEVAARGYEGFTLSPC
jgi:cation diffusion facilitator CzcD-associated flavoprotein CzcO